MIDTMRWFDVLMTKMFPDDLGANVIKFSGQSLNGLELFRK